MIRECTAADTDRIFLVINEAAQSYRRVIPDDCWHEPYMPLDELRREMASMTFFGWDDADGLVAVMGYQPLPDAAPAPVTLIRHAYTLPRRQREGIGGRLLRHLMSMATTGLPAGQAGTLLVGTWAANKGAIRFYERHGFRLLGEEEGRELLRRYWSIPPRQIETSVVLEKEN
ncbi:MAG: GNAT family N-acetyltransferase [Dehalococcoidia bacterium]|nr:GNAT family N-acetyltransferase [Dehalococcoidia bacterium]